MCGTDFNLATISQTYSGTSECAHLYRESTIALDESLMHKSLSWSVVFGDWHVKERNTLLNKNANASYAVRALLCSSAEIWRDLRTCFIMPDPLVVIIEYVVFVSVDLGETYRYIDAAELQKLVDSFVDELGVHSGAYMITKKVTHQRGDHLRKCFAAWSSGQMAPDGGSEF